MLWLIFVEGGQSGDAICGAILVVVGIRAGSARRMSDRREFAPRPARPYNHLMAEPMSELVCPPDRGYKSLRRLISHSKSEL